MIPQHAEIIYSFDLDYVVLMILQDACSTRPAALFHVSRYLLPTPTSRESTIVLLGDSWFGEKMKSRGLPEFG